MNLSLVIVIFSMTDSISAGILAGLSVAFAGVIKDVLNAGEEWDSKKFLRSPVAGLIGSLTLNLLFPIPPFVSYFAAIGFERVTVEVYKLVRSKLSYVPAKFAVGEWGERLSKDKSEG